MSVPNFMATYLIVVKIFQSQPKWWIDHTAIPRVKKTHSSEGDQTLSVLILLVAKVGE